MASNHDKQLTGFLMENPKMMNRLDQLGTVYGPDLQCHLVDQSDLTRDPENARALGLETNDVLVWHERHVYLIKQDGSLHANPEATAALEDD